MCDPVTLAIVGSSAMSAYGSIQEGNAAADAGREQRRLNEIDAKAEIQAGLYNARVIRRAVTTQKSAAKAALAASGVDVNTGTSNIIEEDIAGRGQEDIYQTLLTSQQTAARIRAAGKQAEKTGDQMQTAGYINAGSTALQGFTQAKGWKTGSKTGAKT